jgi:hypothetical protein
LIRNLSAFETLHYLLFCIGVLFLGQKISLFSIEGRNQISLIKGSDGFVQSIIRFFFKELPEELLPTLSPRSTR